MDEGTMLVLLLCYCTVFSLGFCLILIITCGILYVLASVPASGGGDVSKVNDIESTKKFISKLSPEGQKTIIKCLCKYYFKDNESKQKRLYDIMTNKENKDKKTYILKISAYFFINVIKNAICVSDKNRGKELKEIINNLSEEEIATLKQQNNIQIKKANIQGLLNNSNNERQLNKNKMYGESCNTLINQGLAEKEERKTLFRGRKICSKTSLLKAIKFKNKKEECCIKNNIQPKIQQTKQAQTQQAQQTQQISPLFLS